MRRTVPAFGVLVALAAAWLPGSSGAQGTAASAVMQPRPSVDAAAFAIELKGVAPTDGDHRIPNPVTPTGAPVASPATCRVTFRAAAGGTPSTAVNRWISRHRNQLHGAATLCLAGTFTTPVHVWAKTSRALLTIASAPGYRATLELGAARSTDVDPNQYWSDSGGVSIVDSRSVEVEGLTIEDYTTDGPRFSPAGIYVTTRSGPAPTGGRGPHRSACFTAGACSDIYILDNTVRRITNSADSDHTDRAVCDDPDVSAYGIAVIAAGPASGPALQHVVVEGNTVTGTRTGQSETMTFNGDVTDFLVADNRVLDTDNIGIDTIGWELGTSQASHGLVVGNTVADIDTWSNAAYGRWTGTHCAPLPENAAGIYDDGARYIWIDRNVVWNADQGINLDVETNGRSTDHLLVTDNVVHDDPGTASSDPSRGPEPAGVSGRSTVAGHDEYAFYVDAFGRGAEILDVYAADNTWQNQSRYYLQASDGMPTVDIGGRWSDVELWHNTISGGGTGDRGNPLLEIDSAPGRDAVIDCNRYLDLSRSASTVNGNFALPTQDWLSLSAWQRGNGHGWDAHSMTGGFVDGCRADS